MQESNPLNEYPVEITVILKDEERTLKRKFLEYGLFHLRPDDPVVACCIHETKKDFHGEPEKVRLKFALEV